MKTLNTFLFLVLMTLNVNSQGLTKEEELKVTYSGPVGSNIAWEVDGKYILPECFEYEWLSSDNFKEFYSVYIDEDYDYFSEEFNHFSDNVGKYLNKEVPLNDKIKTSWGGNATISLTKNLKNCLSTKPITRILETYKDGRLYHEIEYRVVEDISLDYGKELAPNINERFHSIKKIEIRDNGGGSMGSVYRTIIYGVLEINKNKVLLQLKSIDFNIPSQRR